MTSFPRSFADGAAMLLYLNSRNAANDQSAVDRIVQIVRSSAAGPNPTTDVYAPFDGAQIDTTDGDESDDRDLTVGAYSYARVSTGGGSDEIGVYDRAIINSGGGDDSVSTYAYGIVNSGAGDDYVYGYSHMRVAAGDGNDEVRVSGYSVVDAGNGDDFVVTLGYSRVDGGAGNDTLTANDISGTKDQVGHAVLNGGEGDDDIQIGRNSVAAGSVGNDTVTLVREGSTVEFARGDGQDKIFAADDFALAISGYSKDDVIVARNDRDVIISFAGSDDRLTINLPDERVARLSFADGTEVTINGVDDSLRPEFTVKWTSPEWRSKEDYINEPYTGANGTYTVDMKDRARYIATDGRLANAFLLDYLDYE